MKECAKSNFGDAFHLDEVGSARALDGALLAKRRNYSRHILKQKRQKPLACGVGCRVAAPAHRRRAAIGPPCSAQGGPDTCRFTSTSRRHTSTFPFTSTS